MMLAAIPTMAFAGCSSTPSRTSPGAVGTDCCCCNDPSCEPGCCPECPDDCCEGSAAKTAAAAAPALGAVQETTRGYCCPITGATLPCPKCCPLNTK